MQMIKKVVGVALSFGVAVAMAIDGYIVFFKNQQTSSAANSDTSKTTTKTTSSTKSQASSTSSSTTGKYKDGTYTGSSTSTRWGDVQVQITIAGGKLTKINVLNSPNSEQKSVEINEQALPTYKSEAIKAQSASIQQISGATETYKGFTGSLQNALNQAE
ncbi:FMN-binding domain-containing protein [Companilactobacillus nantensis DSM 16982]|uniref:FMN-binding domain-containing protein n=2 Tax=Companilactobacillus nantensis TaxID=305793 RepID=A0A0R1WHV5_9LACO|nr:FMN-binding domain-containing protein [Companilactobacillus nantensis DSM 16982]